MIGFPGIQIFWRLVDGEFAFGRAQFRFQRPSNGLRHLILEIKHILHFPIVPFRPNMVAGAGINQLRGDAHPVPRFAHTAFQHIAYPKVACDLFNVDRLSLVGEGASASDDHEPADFR